MREYSLSQIEDMQEKALQRVESMREFSKTITGASREHTSPPRDTSRWSQPVKKEEVKKEKHQSGRISMPLNLPKGRNLVYPNFKESFATLNEVQREQTAQQKKAGFLDTVLKDPDESLLFCLLLLLKSEENSEPVLLALLYILWA